MVQHGAMLTARQPEGCVPVVIFHALPPLARQKIGVHFSCRLPILACFMTWWFSRLTRWSGCGPRRALLPLTGAVGLFALTVVCPRIWGAEIKAAAHFRKDIQP